MTSNTLGRILREEFPIFKNHTRTVNNEVQPLRYLDSAASAQKPQVVIDAMVRHMTHDYANVHRGAYALSAESSHLYEESRKTVARFLGKNINPKQIIFTKGSTESINIVASGLTEARLTENSRIVIPMSEHHSNLIPWQQAALRTNAELAYIHLIGTEKEKLALNMDEAAKLITKNTEIVSFSYMGNVMGQINPIKKLIELAKNVNAFVVIDCAQSITCLDEDLFALGADAISFSGHKIYGPTGIGVLALSPELCEILPPFMYGGGMVTSVTEEESEWAAPPAKFEAGTPPITEAVGLSAALKWFSALAPRSEIHAHCSKLATLFVDGLKKINDIEIFSQESGQETIVAFKHNKIHSHDLTTILDSHNIAMRSGHHCAWPLGSFLKTPSICRASFAVYNDVDDVEASLEVLKKTSLF